MKRLLNLIFAVIALSTFITCNKPNDPVQPVVSTSKNITSFIFKVADNPSLLTDITAIISSDSIFIVNSGDVDPPSGMLTHPG